MAKSKGSKSGSSKSRGGPASIKAIQTFTDTLQDGGIDDFHHQKDKIMLGDSGEYEPEQREEEENFLTNRGQEVFGLDLPDRAAEEDMYEEEDDYEDEAPKKKSRKSKTKADVKSKGRYGKDDESDEDEEAASSDDPDAESWGRSYYSRPSTRRGRDMDGDGYGSEEDRKEEERMLEVKEVKRLQVKARQDIQDDDDWGLTALDAPSGGDSSRSTARTEETNEHIEAVQSLSDDTPAPELLSHLMFKEPVKLALARDFPLIVKRLEKTERGIKRMCGELKSADEIKLEQNEDDKSGQNGPSLGRRGQVNEGLGWLHYQTLLSYATTLAFYLHLASLPADERPDLMNHPILPRLLQLKEAVGEMEDADLTAVSDDEGDLIELYDGEDETDDETGVDLSGEEDDEFKRKVKLGKMLMGDGGDIDWEDAEELWEGGELEEGELEELRAAAEADLEEDSDDEDEMLDLEDTEDFEDLEDSEEEEVPVSKSSKKSKSKSNSKVAVLEEPEFIPASKSKSSSRSTSIFDDDNDMGDLKALSASEQAERSEKKRSLRFHTSKIAATSARRAAAREARLQGDEDVPYRDRQAARDAALQRNSKRAAQNGGEDLDGEEWSEKDKKRAREAMDDGGESAYYEQVKRRRTDGKEAKQAAHDEAKQAERDALMAPDSADGPRSLTRAIEKNRGLTPHRAKANRNPRVKKRENYEKAKRKVKSQRAVYSGGQGALGGAYQGEKTGITKTAKSRRF